MAVHRLHELTLYPKPQRCARALEALPPERGLNWRLHGHDLNDAG